MNTFQTCLNRSPCSTWNCWPPWSVFPLASITSFSSSFPPTSLLKDLSWLLFFTLPLKYFCFKRWSHVLLSSFPYNFVSTALVISYVIMNSQSPTQISIESQSHVFSHLNASTRIFHKYLRLSYVWNRTNGLHIHLLFPFLSSYSQLLLLNTLPPERFYRSLSRVTKWEARASSVHPFFLSPAVGFHAPPMCATTSSFLCISDSTVVAHIWGNYTIHLSIKSVTKYKWLA